MQYDKYELKIQKIERFFKLVFKNLPKIIISAAIILATVITVLATRGIITVQAEGYQPQITYGDDLEYKAKAFLSKVEYEYCPEGTEQWTKEFPQEAGTYHVRALAKATFGYRYGSVETFTIEAKEIDVSIASGTVVYGEDPELQASLAYNDRIGSATFSYNEDRTAVEVTSVSILNEDGKDVTANYHVNLASAPIVTAQRPLTIEIVDATKIYDGTPLSSGEYTLSGAGLARGDRVDASFEQSLVDVGYVRNTASYTIYDKNGKDVSRYYKITEEVGYLTVVKRELVVRTADLSGVTYDADAHQRTEYTFAEETSIVDGHSIVAEGWSQLVDAGTVENRIEVFQILDGDGRDVTENYNVNFSWGSLSVDRRPIRIETASDSKIYDGTALSNGAYTVTGEYGILTDHELAVLGSASLIDVGTVENTVTVVIKGENGADVTANYEISYACGTLTVTKRSILVTTADGTWIYSGLERSKQELSIDDLAATDAWRIEEYTKVKNVGEYENEISIRIVRGGLDVTDNYEIRYENGTLEIQARSLTVWTENGEFVYDGQAHGNTEFRQSGLWTAHRLEVIASTTVTYVGEGSVANEFTEYRILDENGEDVTANYEITFQNGVLTVVKREIGFSTASGEKIYDGTPLSAPEWLVTHNSLATGDRIVVNDPEGEQLYAGESKNGYRGELRIFCGETDVTDCYDILAIELGTLTVTKRPIYVMTETVDVVYDGKEHRADTLTVNRSYEGYYGLCDGHSFEVLRCSVFKNVTSGEKNEVDFKIMCGAEDVTDNYEIKIAYGTVTVRPRPIVVSTNRYDAVYDGKDHSDDTLHCDPFDGVNHTGLCEGHELVPTSPAPVFNEVISNEKNIFSFKIVCGSEEIDASNYVITYNWGSVNIRPRPITVSTNGYYDVYDGKDHANSELLPSEKGKDTGLCDEHYLIIPEGSSATIIKDVVTDADNVVPFVIMYRGKDVSANYEITRVWGKVTVLPRPITITTNGYVDVYDGKDHSDSSYGYDSFDAVNKEGLCNGHWIDIKSGTETEIKNVFEGENVLEVEIFSASGPVTHNYAIRYEYGYVKVTPRPLYIVTDSYDDVYDGRDHTAEHNTPRDTSSGEKEGLCEGHSFEVTRDTQIKNVADCQNVIEFIIVCGNERIDQANYELHVTYGTITVTPRPLYIVTDSYDAVYDGRDHTAEHNTPRDTSSGEKEGLCEGHSFEVTRCTTIQDVVSDIENVIEFNIVCGDEVIDKTNYTIYLTQVGRITVTPRPLIVETNGYDGVYDGADHSDGTLTPSPSGKDTGLCEGHRLEATFVPVFNDAVDSAQNAVEFKILCGDEEIDKRNYEITLKYGTVHIAKRVVKLETGSQTWQYDGKSHTNTGYIPLEGTSFAEGHQVRAKSGTETYITEIGEVENSFEIVVFDKSFKNCTHNYEIQILRYGTLRIKPNEGGNEGGVPGEGEGGGPGGGSGNPEGPGILDTSGQIGAPPIIGGEGGEAGESVPSFVVTTDHSGMLYLKVVSFGDYQGQSWARPSEYDELILDYASAQYLTAFALKNYGEPVRYVKIVSKNGEYVLPYYATADDGEVQLSDTYVTGDVGEEYWLCYFAWDYESGVSVPDALREFEASYYEFVKANYLSVDEDTRAYMQVIIDQQGFDANDPDIIRKVAEYIQSAASYSLQYDRALDSSDNVVVAFLFEYKQGICQHYASAATMLYRALGIPARYTCGYVTYAEAGVETEITGDKAHAWVEVYIEGLGWITVEVTGGGPGGGGGSGSGEGEGGSGEGEGGSGEGEGGSGEGEGGSGEGKEEDENPQKEKITVKPQYLWKEYDGTALVATDLLEHDATLAMLVSRGYSYEVRLSGSQLKVGRGVSTVERFVLYDPSGNEVTELYDISYEDGVLEVKGTTIRIYLYQKTFEYTAEEFSYNNDEYLVISIPNGLRLEIREINVSLTNAGTLTSSVINENIRKYLTYAVYDAESGEDVTAYYDIAVVNYGTGAVYDVLTVKPRQFEITTESASKPYDGKPLTCKEFYVSKGYIAEGHTIVIQIVGEQVSEGKSSNSFIMGGPDSYTYGNGNWFVYDENGNDVTDNYRMMSYVLGTLTVY